MPDFWYQALTGQGSVEEGWISASTELQLEEQLRGQGAFLIHAEMRERPNRAASHALPRDELLAFIEHLGHAFGAGVPLLTILDEIPRHLRSSALDIVLSEVRRDVVEHGFGFADALGRHPATFPPSLIAILRSGAATGDIATALRRLATHLEWQDGVASAMRRATTVLAVAFASILALVAGIAAVVFPRLLSVLRDRDIPQPLLTRIVGATAVFVHDHWVLPVTLAVLGAVAVALVHRSTRGRYLLDRMLLRAPLLGVLITDVAFAQVTACFRLFYGAGRDVLQSLALAEQSATNRAVAAIVRAARQSVVGGATLADAFAQPLVPPVLVRHLAFGENDGHLYDALERVDAHFQRRVSAELGRVTAIASLTSVLLLAVIAATVALAILLPSLDLFASIRGNR